MSGKCALVALPNADASSGLLCTTCGETFEKEPICPKQRRRTMTANKPEIFGYGVKKDREPWERSNRYCLSPNPDEKYTVPLIRLSDYEALQADRDQQYDMKVKARKQRDEVTTKLSALYTECEKLRKDVERYRWLRNAL